MITTNSGAGPRLGGKAWHLEQLQLISMREARHQRPGRGPRYRMDNLTSSRSPPGRLHDRLRCRPTQRTNRARTSAEALALSQLSSASPSRDALHPTQSSDGDGRMDGASSVRRHRPVARGEHHPAWLLHRRDWPPIPQVARPDDQPGEPCRRNRMACTYGHHRSQGQRASSPLGNRTQLMTIRQCVWLDASDSIDSPQPFP